MDVSLTIARKLSPISIACSLHVYIVLKVQADKQLFGAVKYNIHPPASASPSTAHHTSPVPQYMSYGLKQYY